MTIDDGSLETNSNGGGRGRRARGLARARRWRRSSRRSKTSRSRRSPPGRFVAIAYGIIWLAVLAYVVMVAAGVKRVNQGDRRPEAQSG